MNNGVTLPGTTLVTPYQKAAASNNNSQPAAKEQAPAAPEGNQGGSGLGRAIRDIALALVGAWPELAAAEGLDAMARKPAAASQEAAPAKEEKKAADDNYTTIVDMAKSYGYTPTDAEVDNIMTAIKGRKTEPVAPQAPVEEEKGEMVEYTYKPGDTFGQVISDLGLESGAGLWGENGDVEYYTKQLMDQGLWENGQRGNIPIGTTIRLRKRPVPENIQAYYDQYGY